MSKTKIEQPQSVSGAFEDLLDKMYISNVQNRLRQLNEPTENDCKRWVWELIQNAKDSISKDEDKNFVDIKLIVKDKEVKFSHNGSPFTAKSQLGLLYKYSEGKANNSESTGRFGTGFLTTHTLSKVVSIDGDVFTDDTSSSICGFSATMYRDGLDESDLLDGVKKMRDSIVYTKEANDWTTYTYYLKTPHNEKSLRLGLDNFISNIAQTMLFCKELNSVELNNNGIITKIIRREYCLLMDDIYMSEFEVNGEHSFSRRFIHKSSKAHSDKLTKRFKTERDLRLTAAIEVDVNNKIVDNRYSPSHFCVLPLVGSERHIMPIYLNSPDFEPDSERESLILMGDDILADKGVISDAGINRLILKESATLYESLVDFLSTNGYSNLYLLAKGLKASPKVERNFDKEWFDQEIINSYRDILKRYDVVETIEGNRKLFHTDGRPNIIIPKNLDLKIQNKLYLFCKDIYTYILPIQEINDYWADFAWKECGLFKIEDLCDHISKIGSLNKLPLSSNQLDWLNNFLGFAKGVEEGLLKKYALVPNQMGDFVSLENESFAQGVDLSTYMLSVLNDLGENLKPYLLHADITAINLPLKIDASVIADKINEQVDEIIKNEKVLPIDNLVEALLPLINTISTSERYNREFLIKQKRINNISKTLYSNLDIKETENNDIPEKGWQILHNWILTQLLKKVSEFGNLESLPNTVENKIEWINNFIAFVSKEIREGQLDNYAIIPNQNAVFCLKKDLSIDIDIPEELKSEIAEGFGIKLKEGLLLKEIDSIKIANEKNINTVIDSINTIYKENRFENSYDALDFSIFLVHFLPDESFPLLYNLQKKVLELVKIYDYKKSECYTSCTIKCGNEYLWTKANDVIIKSYIRLIEENNKIGELENYLSEQSGNSYENKDTIVFLNRFYDYLKLTDKKISGRILPNQNGDFCSLDDELYRDDNIPLELKNILNLVNPNEDFKRILAEQSLLIQPPHSKSIEDIARVIDESIKDIYSNNRNFDDEDFRNAIHLLMMDWFPKHKDFQSKNYFQYTYARKETIEMNVLWSLEERQRMQKAKTIAPELLDKFIESNGNIILLEKKKEELEAKVAELENVIAKEISTEFPGITVERIRELLDLEERIKGWNAESDYQPIDKIEERRNFENGYKGEAYVYGELLKSGYFKSVIWEHKSLEPTEMEIIDYKNNSHYIKDNFSKYDLIAETYVGNKIYIEVKSTRTSIEEADKIAFPISSQEWKFVNQIDEGDRYCLARVFNVENNPEGHYLSLMGIGLGGHSLLEY